MTHASLFSGIGGFDLAAEWMGWHNAFHCEINEFCTKILNYHFPDAEHYTDITRTDFSKWGGRIDVLSGGFPCQPFSLAGQRKGADDNRYLWPQMLRAIREIRPTWVVGENVAGILTMVQPGAEVEVGGQASLFGEDYRKRVLHRQEYDSPCWVVWDKKNGKTDFADCELAWTSFNKSAKLFAFRWSGFLQEDMKNKEVRIHPTQKPVALYKFLLETFAKPGNRILDTHLGSGSSRIAAYKMGFDFWGTEIDEEYFNMQEKRFREECIGEVRLKNGDVYVQKELFEL